MKKNKKITIDQLHAFSLIPKCGSIRNVSKLVNITPAAVSALIINLETALGIKLFIRHQNGLELTAEGHRFYEKTLKLLSEYDDLKNTFTETDDISGQIRVSTWHGIASFVLAAPLAKFTHKFNNKIFIDVVCDNLGARFEDFHCDVAIRPMFKDRHDLVQENLFSIKFNAYASKEYIKKKGLPKQVSDLDNHDLLSSFYVDAEKFAYADWHLFAGMPGRELRKPILSINSSMGLATCCDQGLGIATFPEYYKEHVKNELIEVLPGYPSPDYDFYFIYPKVSENSKRIQLLKAFLLEELKNS